MKAATVQQPDCKLAGHISIHAAREGGDRLSISDYADTEISIHAAREGGDAVTLLAASNAAYFNPRRP